MAESNNLFLQRLATAVGISVRSSGEPGLSDNQLLEKIAEKAEAGGSITSADISDAGAAFPAFAQAETAKEQASTLPVNLRRDPDSLSAPNWPTSGSLYALGDSQTYGTNTSGGSYTTSSRINEQYRWPNIVAGSFGKSLTVTNLGAPARRLSDDAGGTDTTIWNSWGSVPYNWTGVVAMMLGYNNSDANTITPAFFANIERAYRCYIARALVDDYAGIGTSGWGSTGSAGGTVDGFTTTGAANTQTVTAGQSATRNPFYYGDVDGAKRRITLTTGQYVEFTTSNKKAISLFLNSSPTGGAFTVTINGVERTTGTTAYTGMGGNDVATDHFPHVVWLENLPASATVRFTAGSGTIYWQAYGWVPETGSRTASKVVCLAAVTGNQASSRTDKMLRELNYRAQSAVAQFASWPVYFADVWTGWDRYYDDEYSDVAHFTITGHAKVAAAFDRAGRAYRPVAIEQPVTMRTLAEWMDGIRIVNMDPTTWGTGGVANSAALATTNAQIQFRSTATPGSQLVAKHSSGGNMKTLLRSGDLISGSRNSGYITWSNPFRVSFSLEVSNATSTGIGRLYFGRAYNNTTVGDIAERGIGIKLNNLALVGQVYNGTAGSGTLTESATLITLSANIIYKVVVENSGGGTVKIWVNDVLLWTTALGPTGDGANLSNSIELSGTNGANAAFYIWGVQDIKVVHLPLIERLA